MMLDSELMDVLSTEGKQAGGYCTSIEQYEVPFIFANFNGTQGDVEVVTHEAGHAFAYWLNRKRVPAAYTDPTAEACEVHSMSMEFFGWKNAEGFFGPDARKFMYSHLAGALTFIPYGTMVDHFQHIVYERPEMTPKERHAEWKRLMGVYTPWLKLDGEIPFFSDGEHWQRQIHIYQMPFYYIDYCLAQAVALEFWSMDRKDHADAWKHYMAYTSQGGSRTFTDLLKNANLATPFDEACLKGVCETATKWLASFDMTGIEGPGPKGALMSTRKEIVSEFYGGTDEDTRLLRSVHGRLEYAVTMAYIHRWARRGSKVLEIGAGTGRYSVALAKEGMDVTAVELTESNLALLRENGRGRTNQDKRESPTPREKRTERIFAISPIFSLSGVMLKPTPSISMARKALAFPTMPVNSATGQGRLSPKAQRRVIRM